MVSVEKAVTARITKGGTTFEILVDSEKALQLKKGSPVSIENILAVNEVFKDARKGERVSSTDLQKAFGTTDVFKVAEEIIRHGDVQLTTEQRRAMVEEKRKEIAGIISKQGINPQTKLPHPPARILNAMEQAHVAVDPFKSANEQVEKVLEQVQEVIPISLERVEIAIRVPIEFAGKASSVMRNMLKLKKEEWKTDAWICLVEIPAGMQGEIYEKLNSLTAGRVEVKVVRRIEA